MIKTAQITTQLTAYISYLKESERSCATQTQYYRDIRRFLSWAGDAALAKETVIRYKEMLQAEYKAASVNAKLAAINSFFSFLGKNELRVRQLRIQRQAYCSNEKELATQMVGRQVESIVTKAEDPHGPVVLELKNVRLHKRAQETVSIQVHAGEIFGIAGGDGNGQQELEEMIVGNRKTEEGTISMNGKEVQNLSVKERKAMGLGYIPSDRHKDAMVPDFSITENFLLGYQEDPKYCKKGFIDYKALEEDAKVQVEQFEIKIAGVSQHIGQLSGGNQQKVILGRETSHDPSFMLVAQPVRGLDIGAIERVHKTLLQLKKEGKAILLISAELSEVMNLSDRIAVLYEGEMSAQFKAGQYTKEEIGLFMAGKKQEDVANEMDQQ